MSKKDAVLKLIERYESKQKNEWDEAQVRTSLLNPFWRALGWEIDDPEQVEVEKRIHMPEHLKWADYAFLENKRVHFLVEAKAPAHNLTKDKDAIFQVKRYVYNTPETFLGILHDFEEFLPIIVLKTPDFKTPHVGLQKSRFVKYTEYVEKWDELCELYSREAVMSGSLEKLLPQGTKIEKVTEPLDRKFFNDLTHWRKEIAKSIAKRNPHITDERINESVNDLLNRILFLRVIEDRKIESQEVLHHEWLRWQHEQRGSLWAYLLELFANLNPRYNGTLFQRQKDDPLATIIIDDNPLYELIKNLYYPDSPYQFSKLPVEIIGNAYEKYLGSVIRTTPSRMVKLEEKPEVRKAGGVYYTPKYIVEYIVEQTIGRLLDGDTVGARRASTDTEGDTRRASTDMAESAGDARDAPTRKPMKPKQVRQLKILDPACGSGSFLIGAYERLEQYYLDYYRKHPKENKGFLVKTPEGKTKLSFKIKQQILMDNLHGVDIDEQAVNITKFSLYVKLMEDEDYMSQNVLIGQALLPDLKNNIKCGNSLVGWDILDMGILPEGAERDDILKKIEPFDWEDAFPMIFHRKHLKAYHITWVTHNSRVSERMVEVKAKHGEPVSMNQETQSIVIDAIIEKAERMNVPIMAFNILHDHVHLVLACEEDELEKVVQGLKGYSSYQVGRRLKSSVQGGGKQQTLWAKHYNKSFLESEEKFRNALEYVAFNHLKHEEPLNPRLQSWARKNPEKAPESWLVNSGLQSADTEEGRRLKSSVQVSSIEIVSPDEAFSDKFAIAGGFDAVIGNPPWISITGRFRNEGFSKNEIDYLIYKHKGNTYMPNMYEYFISQGLNLFKKDGYFSLIVPDRLGYNKQFIKLRERILRETLVISIGYRFPFPGITADTMVFVLRKADYQQNSHTLIFEYGKQKIALEQNTFIENETHIFEYYENEDIMKFLLRITNLNSVVHLSNICDTTSGFGGKSKLITSNRINQKQISTMKGNSIDRYMIKKTYWFDFSKENITGRTTDKNKLGSVPKVLLRKTGDKIIATFDDSGIFPEQSLYFLFNNKTNISFHYILGLLNSCFMNFFYRNKSLTNKASIAQVKKVDLDKLPIRTIDFTNPSEVKNHDLMVSLVEEMLDHHKRLAEAQVNGGLQSTASGKGRRLKSPVQNRLEQIIQKQIEITDKKIDKLVYELYGLTEEEIRLVEGEGK